MQLQKITSIVRKRAAKHIKTENSRVGFVQKETENYDCYNVVMNESRNLWSRRTAQQQWSLRKLFRLTKEDFKPLICLNEPQGQLVLSNDVNVLLYKRKTACQ